MDSSIVTLQCPNCFAWVSTGARASSLFYINGQKRYFTSFVNHSISKKCRASYLKSRQLSSEATPSPSMSYHSLGSHSASPLLLWTFSTPLNYPLNTSFTPTTEVSASSTTLFDVVTRPEADMALARLAIWAEAKVVTYFLLSINSCHSIDLVWPGEIGPFNETFPWSRIGDGPDTLPFWLNVTGNSEQKRIIVAKNCTTVASTNSGACDECAMIPAAIKHLADLSSHAKSHTPYGFLSARQLKEHLVDVKDDANRWKLKVHLK
jgi:hypothetical protein